MPVHTMQKARRAHSLPSRFMLPSEEMGEYESGAVRRRSAPARPAGGGLYPLPEEGSYGAAPRGPPPPAPKYQGRERKPKVYSSYSLDNNCAIHKKKLEKAEDSIVNRSMPSRKYSGSSVRSSRTSASPSRMSVRTVSASPDRSRPGSRMSGSSSPERQIRVRKPSSDSRASTSSFSSSASSTGSNRYTSSNRFRDLRESSFEENEEYEYVENQRSNGYSTSSFKTTSRYSSFANNLDNDRHQQKNLSRSMGGLSLDGMRAPKIDSWDSMGILGLTARMWNETKKNQESFLQSTGKFLREDHRNINTYVM